MKGETLVGLKEIEGIIKVTENENKISLTIDSTFKLGKVLSYLEKNNINIKKISYEEAKLEDVFLTITGKQLRD